MEIGCIGQPWSIRYISPFVYNSFLLYFKRTEILFQILTTNPPLYVNASNITGISRRSERVALGLSIHKPRAPPHNSKIHGSQKTNTTIFASSNIPGRTYVSVLPSQPQPNTDPAEPLKSPTITTTATFSFVRKMHLHNYTCVLPSGIKTRIHNLPDCEMKTLLRYLSNCFFVSVNLCQLCHIFQTQFPTSLT